MPDFGNPFSGMTAGRKVTHEELVRAIRFLVAAEYEAVQLYVQLAESTDNHLARTVLRDIADEEIVHAGEFLALLKALAPAEQALYDKGAEEVREMMAALGGQNPESVEPAREQSRETEPAPVETAPSPPSIGSLFRKTQTKNNP